MKKLDEGQVALITGLFLAGLHTLWALLVAFALAQPFLSWIYGIHFLNNPFIVSDFNIMTAVTLVVVTFVTGYIAGWVFTWIWNRMLKK